MKLKLYLFIFLAFAFYFSSAQSNYYYYYQGERVYMNLDKSTTNISVFNQFQKSSINNSQLKEYDLLDDTSQNISSNLKYAKIEFQSTLSDTQYFQELNTIKNTEHVRTVYPSFIGLDGTKIGLSDYLYVKLKSHDDYSILQQKADYYNLSIIEQNQFMPLWYILRCNENTVQSSLQVANEIFETDLFASAIPDLLTYDDLYCTNDTFFYDSWGLSNTGQNGGANGIDINACDAWNISQGENVIVAVLDNGIEFNHPDLSNNIHPLSYDTESNSSPSLVLGDHGVACAGIIGAEKDNNQGIAGVSPNAQLMSISNSFAGLPNSRIRRADGINWAVENGADIISNSWGSGVEYDVIDDAITNALTNGRGGLGTIVIFATGNSNNNVAYPANSNDDIIAVGAMSPCGERKSPSSCDGETGWGSNFGNELDVVAPGVLIPTTDRQGANGYNPQGENDPNYSGFNDYFSRFNGTSSATPHVAGVAALVLSVNPCLSHQQVSDIIEQTSQKVGNYSYTNSQNRPNGTWNDEMGYGLVDAHAAVQMAISMSAQNLDLYTKDGSDDNGIEPNTTTISPWNSPDIWIRNDDDNGTVHQDPEYRENGNPNYIYVKVRNRSCVASDGTDTMQVHWAKSNTSYNWPNYWDGSEFINGTNIPLGGSLNPVSIPVVLPGDESIIKIPWVVPNPEDYAPVEAQWHFCLMSRILSNNDTMTYPETGNARQNIDFNNNIAQKNVTIVDLVSNETTGTVHVGNPFNNPKMFYLEFFREDLETGKPIYEEAEVGVKMDDILYAAWERGGKEAENLDSTTDEKKKIVKGNHVILDNLYFNPKEYGKLTLDFNFLTEELTDKDYYKYHVVQKDSQTGEVLSGETFIIAKNYRYAFFANAGDNKEVNKNEPITISASDISEPAIYNWYDNDGNLIFQGKDLTISTDVSTTYKLEVIALSDGFKDYDEVEVSIKPNYIESISPNPASSSINVTYKINNASSAYLMVLGYYGSSTSNNYILDVNTNNISIDLTNYPLGTYTVALVCDGEIVDAKNLIKQ